MNNYNEDIFMVSYDKNLEEEVEKLFVFWRKEGYPNYKKESYDKEKELNKLIKYDETKIFDYETKKLKQTMHGCGFL